ncbi:protein-export chaperone SecB [Metabacillus fastidiosus]|uniref:protein-export chaperone SecB n=1 Tax=Metabacillus fastidiosus TaxID=1458 RepID=UPI002E1D5584|nr:protein-export chaperone SecB [Metabacillus fastidiosus]MED4533211.1 protein-export chaperone SecB [Metabacillus fastidiosus]
MNLDSNKYRELIRNIDIQGVNLRDLTVKSSDNKHQKNIEISAKHEVSSFKRDGDLFLVQTKFDIEGFIESQNVFSIDFQFEVIYFLESSLSFEEEYLEVFTKNNVPVNVWPYARELVSSLTLKMGISALMLPVLRV